MSIRLILLCSLVLVCFALAACPAQDSGNGSGEEPAVQAEPQDRQPAEPRQMKANPITTVSKLVSAMNKDDSGGFELLLAPDAPAREELLSKFEEFDPSQAQISLEDASIKSLEDGEAVIIYDLQVTYSDGESKPEWETGEFTLRLVDDVWLVWDVS